MKKAFVDQYLIWQFWVTVETLTGTLVIENSSNKFLEIDHPKSYGP